MAVLRSGRLVVVSHTLPMEQGMELIGLVSMCNELLNVYVEALVSR